MYYYFQVHKGRPSAFLKKPLQFEKKMFELFGGTFATGSMAWSINSTGPSLFDKGKMVDVDEGSGDSDDGEVNGDKGYDDDSCDASRSPSKSLSGKKRKSTDSKRTMKEDLETCMDVLRKNIQLGSSKAQSTPSSSLYERLITTLQDIPEVKVHGN